MGIKPSLTAFKLLKQRKDGTLGPLFINRKARIPIGVELFAEDHPTPGFAHRPGWHCVPEPHAVHLSERGRVWVEVEIKDFTIVEWRRNTWFIAKRMRVRKLLPSE